MVPSQNWWTVADDGSLTRLASHRNALFSADALCNIKYHCDCDYNIVVISFYENVHFHFCEMENAILESVRSGIIWYWIDCVATSYARASRITSHIDSTELRWHCNAHWIWLNSVASRRVGRLCALLCGAAPAMRSDAQYTTDNKHNSFCDEQWRASAPPDWRSKWMLAMRQVLANWNNRPNRSSRPTQKIHVLANQVFFFLFFFFVCSLVRSFIHCRRRHRRQRRRRRRRLRRPRRLLLFSCHFASFRFGFVRVPWY